MSNKKHSCDVCDKSYTFKQNLYRHVKASHTNSSIVGAEKNRLKCPICKFTPQSVLILNNHLKNEHGISLEYEEREFDNESDFLSWKRTIESESLTNFIKVRGSKFVKKGFAVTYYKCHRSGKFVSKSNGLRRLKIQGSNKINAVCPASIKHSVNRKGRIFVSYQKVHVGHERDLGHLTLSEAERERIAQKIASNVSLDVILDEVRNSFSNSKLGRIHLLTKQDLHNIEKRYNLTALKNPTDINNMALDKWVEEMQRSKSCCVVLYKPLGTVIEQYPQLGIEDFLLIIMNEAQHEMLEKYGHDCVCIDRTNCLNAYNYEMISLVVLDDDRQGFPCAFLITSRVDEISLSIFLSLIKQKVGGLKPEVFLSDVADVFYNCWSEIMGVPKNRLYCSWLVDAAWRKNLSIIKNKTKQREVYMKLRTLMEEFGLNNFHNALERFLEELLMDKETTDFGLYFASNYINNATYWACCYRINSVLDTNMHLERLHRTTRYIYLQGRNVKRLNKTVHAIMQFVRDKLIDRIIFSQNKKISSDVKNLRVRHRKSKMISKDRLTYDGKDWKVASVIGKELYTVQEIRPGCKCGVICQDCDTCIHKYTCSCVDSAIKWNMCKHIHMVCMLRKKKIDYSIQQQPFENNSQENGANDLLEYIENNNVLSNETFSNNELRVVEKGKEDLTIQFQHLLDMISTTAQIDIVKTCIESIFPVIGANECSDINVNSISMGSNI